jgi:hypothetical protein
LSIDPKLVPNKPKAFVKPGFGFRMTVRPDGSVPARTILTHVVREALKRHCSPPGLSGSTTVSALMRCAAATTSSRVTASMVRITSASR